MAAVASLGFLTACRETNPLMVNDHQGVIMDADGAADLRQAFEFCRSRKMAVQSVVWSDNDSKVGVVTCK